MALDMLFFALACAIAVLLWIQFSMIQDCWKYMKNQDKQIENLQEQINVIREELFKGK